MASKNFLSPRILGCWIRSEYPVQQIALDYVFMWVTAFVNIILYVPLALVIEGKITVNGSKIHLRRKDEKSDIRKAN